MAEEEPNDPAPEEEPESWLLRNPGRTVLLVAAAAVVLMAMWAASWALWKPGDMTDRGAFGDAFAPIVGLISSLALGAAVLSVFIQRRELALQRGELFLTRQEAKKQRQAAQDLADATGRANELAEQRLEAERASARQARAANILAARAQLIEIAQLGALDQRQSQNLRGFLLRAAPDLIAETKDNEAAQATTQVFCVPLFKKARDQLRLLEAEGTLEFEMRHAEIKGSAENAEQGSG